MECYFEMLKDALLEDVENNLNKDPKYRKTPTM